MAGIGHSVAVNTQWLVETKVQASRVNTETVDNLGRGKNTPHHCRAVAYHPILSIIPGMFAQPSHSSRIWGSNEVALSLNSCHTWPTLTDANSRGGYGSSKRMAWIFQIKEKDILFKNPVLSSW